MRNFCIDFRLKFYNIGILTALCYHIGDVLIFALVLISSFILIREIGDMFGGWSLGGGGCSRAIKWCGPSLS